MKKILTGAVLAFALIIPVFSFAQTAPTLTITANPTAVISGQGTTISWSSTNATHCNFEKQNLQPSGSMTVSLSQTTTYSIQCTGLGGSVTKSVTVTVTASQAPTISVPLTDQFLDEQTQSECVDLKFNLRQGSRDARTKGEVSVLQNFLIEEGYLSGEATGFFGFVTRVAVQKFQSAVGIGSVGTPGYGNIGPKSRAKIKAMTCGVATIDTTNTAIVTTVRKEAPKVATPTNTTLSTVSGCFAGALFSTMTGQRCDSATQGYSTELEAEVARLNGADALIKANLASARGMAELYHTGNSSSYLGVCGASYMGLLETRNIIAKIGSTPTCNDLAATWAMSAPLRSNPAEYFCADSTGFAKPTTSSIGLATYCSVAPTPIITSPKVGDNWEFGKTYSVQWNVSEALRTRNVHLVRNYIKGMSGWNIGSTNSSQLDYTVSQALPTGVYSLVVCGTSCSEVVSNPVQINILNPFVVPTGPPTISHVSPIRGVVNDIITIYGSNFVNTTSRAAKSGVEFLQGGQVVGNWNDYSFTDGTQLRFRIESGLKIGNYQLRVINFDTTSLSFGNSNFVNFSVIQ